jgi:hypothetical protein
MNHEIVYAFLKEWGLNPEPKPTLTSGVSIEVSVYANSFPATKNLFLFGNAFKAVDVASWVVQNLLSRDKLTFRASLIKIPEFIFLPSWENELYTKVSTADLVIIQEIGFTKYPPQQLVNLYNLLINSLMKREGRLIFTSGNPPEEVAQNIGKSLMDYITAKSILLNIGE